MSSEEPPPQKKAKTDEVEGGDDLKKEVSTDSSKQTCDEVAAHQRQIDEAAAQFDKRQFACSRFKLETWDPLMVKKIHFVRHGEGTHNALAKKIGHDGYKDPSVADARLTDLGRQQAASNMDLASTLPVELVVVSPLSRAIETATISFNAALKKGIPFLARENLREQIGKNLCDQRRSVTSLQKDYPGVDFTQLATEDDELWTEQREPKLGVAERGSSFMSWLGERAEKEVAVVCHSSFLLTLFSIVLKCDTQELQKWFETGELRSVYVHF